MTSVAWWELAGHNTHIKHLLFSVRGIKEERFPVKGRVFESPMHGKWSSDFNNKYQSISVRSPLRELNSRYPFVKLKYSATQSSDVLERFFFPLSEMKKHWFGMLKLMQDIGKRQRRRHENKTESARKSSRVEHLTNKQFLNALCCCLSRNSVPSGPIHLSILHGWWRCQEKRGQT